jgi:beta-glucanase (GH16 family)
MTNFFNKQMMFTRYLFALLCGFLLMSCSQDIKQNQKASASEYTVYEHSVSEYGVSENSAPEQIEKKHYWYSGAVTAFNIGGEQHQGVDDVNYQTDTLLSSGTIGYISDILGTQDNELYQTYRSGDIDIHQPITNGIYDVIFKFAEPNDHQTGTRVFDVYVQGKLVIDDLDIKQARDGKARSALDRAVTSISVVNGQLDITFVASKGEPLLNAIVIRKKVVVTDDVNTWKLVWNDEFNYQGPPDKNKWSYDIWPARKVNAEDQAYTDDPRNIEVKDGNLIITAHKEKLDDAEYTSSRIHSQGKGDFLYGRAEIRAKLPAGQGTWSAIWMLPSDPYKYATHCEENEDWQGSETCDAWPNSGEIDIMEHVGFDMQNVHGTVHNKAYYWINWQQRKGSVEARTVDTEFHTYAVEWTPDSIIVFFDDSPYFFYSNDHTGWKSWPYDHPFHIILNLAIGGMWGTSGGPIDDSIFPVSMLVDYVRVYESVKKNP